jgi:uncharacterized damage-inducible protein DinB
MPNNTSSFLITDISGYTPQVSRLISMMNYARDVTLSSVQNLSPSQLDFLIDTQANSVGALLMHIASTEFYYRVLSFEKRELYPAEEEEWATTAELGQPARDHIKGHDLNYYLGVLNITRDKTLDMFKQVNDDWLYEEVPFWDNKPANNYFMWFHVFEDEINHRGQINLIKKRLPEH